MASTRLSHVKIQSISLAFHNIVVEQIVQVIMLLQLCFINLPLYANGI